jgi:hypothetical protein
MCSPLGFYSTLLMSEHPVHSLPLDAYRQRIQSLMRAATGTEPVREAEEVDLINLVEDRFQTCLGSTTTQDRTTTRE